MYEQWKFQVKGMRSSCPEGTVRSALITSVWGEASELVSFLGFNAPMETLLDAMEDRFGKKITRDWLQQDFYQLQQEKGEKVQHFVGRLEKAFKKLQEAIPETYLRNQLKERLFHSVNQQTRDSMRYLCDRESTTYEVLLAAMKKAETEWSETCAQFRMKGAAVVEKKELDKLKERLDKLQATIKSATVKAEKDKKKTPKTSPCKDDPRKTKKDHILHLLDLSDLIRNPCNAINVRGGVTVGESVQQREMSIGGGCTGIPPPQFKMPPNQNNSNLGSSCFAGLVS